MPSVVARLHGKDDSTNVVRLPKLPDDRETFDKRSASSTAAWHLEGSRELGIANFSFANKVTPPESLPSWKLDNSSPRPKSGRVLAPLRATTAKNVPIGTSPTCDDKVAPSMGNVEPSCKHQVANLVDSDYTYGMGVHSHQSACFMTSSENFAADIAASERRASRHIEEDEKLNEELDRLRKLVAQDVWSPYDPLQIDDTHHSKTKGAAESFQWHPTSVDIDIERIANMPLRTPSPHVSDYPTNTPSTSYEAQLSAMNSLSREMSSDPFEREIAAVTRAALVSTTPDELEISAAPLPPCLSPDMMTHLFCASKAVGTLNSTRDSTYLSSYNTELEYFQSSGDMSAGNVKLDEFWSHVDESLSCPLSPSANFDDGPECRGIHLNADEHPEHPQASKDSPPHNSPPQLVSVVKETKPEDPVAQADKELQTATWVGDAARLESAIAEGRAVGVSASAISIAEQVLRREVNKKHMEDELNNAVTGRDVFRLKTAISDALKSGVMPSKIREAKAVLRDLQDS